MYARQTGGRTLTFAVSGLLLDRSLVMLDSETESYWSHLLGRALYGPLKDTDLKRLPSSMTDWETWRSLRPETTVVMLARTSSEYRREFYRDPSLFLIGMAEGGKARAWTFDRLREQPIVNDEFAGIPLLVVFEPESSTAYLYDRRVNGRTLLFEHAATGLIDVATRSEWDASRLGATDGPLKGSRLGQVPGVVSFVRAWMTFHPETSLWHPRKQETGGPKDR